MSIMVMSTLAVTYATFGKQRLYYEEREQREDLISDERWSRHQSVSMFKVMREGQKQDLWEVNHKEMIPRFGITFEEDLAQRLLLSKEKKERAEMTQQ